MDDTAYHAGHDESLGGLPEVSEKAPALSKLYKTGSDAHKTQMLKADIAMKSAMLFSKKAATPVNFNSIDDVKERTRIYLDACAVQGLFPSMMGLAAYGFGVSRQALYQYLSRHPGTPSSEFINQTRDTIADVLSSAALMRNADAVTTIFILKNGLGFSDRVEIEPIQPNLDTNPKSIEEIRAHYAQMTTFEEENASETD